MFKSFNPDFSGSATIENSRLIFCGFFDEENGKPSFEIYALDSTGAIAIEEPLISGVGIENGLRRFRRISDALSLEVDGRDFPLIISALSGRKDTFVPPSLAPNVSLYK